MNIRWQHEIGNEEVMTRIGMAGDMVQKITKKVVFLLVCVECQMTDC